VSHLNRLDDYSFHSTLASSLCLGWIADAPDFDSGRGKSLLDRYRGVRHLLTGAWYPLLPYSQSQGDWMAAQYHRPDLDEGLVLVFRRPESPYTTLELSLRGIDAPATYEISFDTLGAKSRVRGSELLEGFRVTLPAKQRSELITYRKLAQ